MPAHCPPPPPPPFLLVRIWLLLLRTFYTYIHIYIYTHTFKNLIQLLQRGGGRYTNLRSRKQGSGGPLGAQALTLASRGRDPGVGSSSVALEPFFRATRSVPSARYLQLHRYTHMYRYVYMYMCKYTRIYPSMYRSIHGWTLLDLPRRLFPRSVKDSVALRMINLKLKPPSLLLLRVLQSLGVRIWSD